jgi:hypothetical protein
VKSTWSKPIKLFLFLAAWGVLLGGGFWRLLGYANTPGESAQASVRWPVVTSLTRDLAQPTLVVFAHPHCPCSEATVGELERLMPKLFGKVKSLVVFYQPKSKSEAWVTEALWKKAQAIPGVQTVLDQDGVEAKRFGAKTSGQVFLYDSNGGLVFQGGITPQRGHMGDSDGRLAILSLVETGTTKISAAPVFGCALRNPERAIAEVKNGVW